MKRRGPSLKIMAANSHGRGPLYIVSGPVGQGGIGSKGFKESLAGGKVVVPAECWKIIVVVEPGFGDDLARISMGTRVIAVDMPNDQTRVGEEWAISHEPGPDRAEDRVPLFHQSAARHCRRLAAARR